MGVNGVKGVAGAVVGAGWTAMRRIGGAVASTGIKTNAYFEPINVFFYFYYFQLFLNNLILLPSILQLVYFYYSYLYNNYATNFWNDQFSVFSNNQFN